jgi:hypothetical protein
MGVRENWLVLRGEEGEEEAVAWEGEEGNP